MLKKIKLENFRNHKTIELTLEKTNIIIGGNGEGKTNILEAISLISCCRSFRDDDKKNLVNYEAGYARVVASQDLEIFIQKEPRLLFKAKHKGMFKKRSEFIGILPSVIFSPETIAIIDGSPKERRRFLDIMISQIDRQYLESLILYEKTRSNRNNLLQLINQGRANKGELKFWNTELIKHGTYIINSRQKALEEINKLILGAYQTIAESKENLILFYAETVKGDYAQKFEEVEYREISSGHTLVGPHRDDITFYLDSRDMSKFASRGEVRSAILALKIGEINLIKKAVRETFFKPILLLDDVFSEFDSKRRKHLFKLIEEYQTVITTTDKEFIDDKILAKANIIKLPFCTESII